MRNTNTWNMPNRLESALWATLGAAIALSVLVAVLAAPRPASAAPTPAIADAILPN